MRSYSYSEGKWHPYKDSLPAAANMIERYQAYESYEQAMQKKGFAVRSSDSYTSRLGPVTVYARDHATLSAERKANETFDFLCVLSIGGSSIRVWIPDLYSLFLFFVDIDAKAEEGTFKALKDFLSNRYLQDMIVHISVLADQMVEGNMELTIRHVGP